MRLHVLIPVVISMSLVGCGSRPATQMPHGHALEITIAPPETIPEWVQSDSNSSGPKGPDGIGFPFYKRVIRVFFHTSATLEERRAAVALVNGIVVGGWRAGDGVGGFYVVEVADDGSGFGLMRSAERLQALPQVEVAGVWTLLGAAAATPGSS